MFEYFARYFKTGCWARLIDPSCSGQCVSQYGPSFEANFFPIMKGKYVIRPSVPTQNTVRTGGFPLDQPTQTKKSSQHLPRFRRRPPAHADIAKSSWSPGIASPWSRRSAITRSASASALAIACFRVFPYAMIPDRSGASAIHRPFFSRSISIFMCPSSV